MKKIYVFASNNDQAKEYQTLASTFISSSKAQYFDKRNGNNFDDVRFVAGMEETVPYFVGVNLFVPNDAFKRFILEHGQHINQNIVMYRRLTRDKFMVIYSDETYIIQAVTDTIFNVLAQYHDDTELVAYEKILLK